MKVYFCWKCERELPFLDEIEWTEIAPMITSGKDELVEYRNLHNCDLATARANVTPEVSKRFECITGYAGIHFDIIAHHRLSDWGAECSRCGSLLRTNKARFCAACGWANPLMPQF